MNLNNLTIQEKAEMEKFIARNVEVCLCRMERDLEEITKIDLQIAEINMDFYYDHVKQYGVDNFKRYYNLKNRYDKIKGGNHGLGI